MEARQDQSGGLASTRSRVGVGIGLLAVVVALVAIFGGDDGDATSTAESAGLAASDPASDARPQTGPRIVSLPDGTELAIELFVAPTSSATIIAAPSRNADLTSIAPVGTVLVDADCANVIAFDAQSVDASPLSLYQALFDMLLADDFGPIFADGTGTLGASFTGLPSWQAARDNDADYSFVFAPSDLFPEAFSPDAVPLATLFVGDGDDGFLPQFEQWREAGFNGATVPGSEHGSALFTGENDSLVLSRLERTLCF